MVNSSEKEKISKWYRPKFERVDYLRLSVTDRCNLRCIYCMPSDKVSFLPAYEILSFEEIVEIVKMLETEGIKYVRLTGGEPLLRRDIEVLISKLRKESLIKEISMTTNGVFLGNKLSSLIEAGLDRLNISLDTFKRDRYNYLTGRDRFNEVFSSIKEALSIPVLSVKINTIIIKGINDDEIEDFAIFTLKNKVCVRFIEYFSINKSKLTGEFIPNLLIKEKIEKRFGRLIPDKIRGKGPAVNYRINGAQGNIGFINTRTANFCQDCNRLRLTSEGKLYFCLFSPFNINLKEMLRKGMEKREIELRLKEFISKKWDYLRKMKDAVKDSKFFSQKEEFLEEDKLVMSEIGG